MTEPAKRTDKKQTVVDGVIYKYSTKWIYSLESELHWHLYWWQQKVMQDLVRPGDCILEIGVGSGFTANYLRSKGVYVTTFDIDEEKKPDITGNIVTHKFQSSYDHILAFEVLEHIPFNQAETVLPKISSVCKKYLFVSIPIAKHVVMYIDIKLPYLSKKSFTITTKKKQISNHHFWEIGHSNITHKTIQKLFHDAHFKIINSKRIFSTHQFYALKKQNI